MRVYGPYISKADGRRRVVLRYPDWRMTTKSFARYLYESEFGRIPDSLTIDHIDEDFTNDSLSNLQVLSREENARKSLVANGKIGEEKFEGICPECGERFSKLMRYVRANTKRGSDGPFCS